MRRVAVVASHRREFDGILRRAGVGDELASSLHFARTLTWKTPKLGDTEWLLLADGIGAVAATRACASITDPGSLDAILSIGYCGATQPRWKRGDLLAASLLRHAASGEEFACVPVASSTLAVSQGVILTVDRIIRFAADKHRIGEDGVDAVEMEATAVAKFARRHGVPFVALKAVSDTSEEDLPIDFDRARRADGGTSVRSVLAQAMTRPCTGIVGLGRLAKSARLASDTLGEAMMGVSW